MDYWHSGETLQITLFIQSNTEKNRNVLSNFMIGWQVLLRDDIQFTKKELIAALEKVALSTAGEILC